MPTMPTAPITLNAFAADGELPGAAREYFAAPTKERLAALEALLGEGQDRATLLRAATVMLQAANDALDIESVEITRLIAQQGGSVACKAGCAACCSQAIPCLPVEAALIGLYLEDRPELRERFRSAYAMWDARTSAMRESFIAWAERSCREGLDDGSHRFADFDTPCPFIDDGLCLVYPARPYPCRAYLAVNEECHSPSEGRPGLQGKDFGALTGHKRARRAMTDMLHRRLGLDPARIRTRLMPELVETCLRAGPEGLLALVAS